MQDTRSRSAQSGPSEGRPPSPLRPIPSLSDVEDQGSFDGDARIREAFPLHGMKASDIQHAARPPRPHIDTRQSFSTSPPYLGPTPPHHISPQSGSPYANGRGGWAGQQPPPYHPQHGYSPTHQGQPPFRQSNYSPTGPPGSYYPSHAPPVGYPGPPNHQMHPGYQPQSFRGGHAGYRGNHYGPPPDRRFSGSGPQGYPPPHNQRGRGGHFNNLSWTAPGRGAARGQYEQPQGMMHHHQSPPHAPPQLTPQRSSFESAPSNMEEEDNPFRPSKDLQVEDQSLDNNPSSNGGSPSTNQMPPPTRPSPAQPKEGPRFSFAFKSKAPPAPTTPKADLSQKVREPLPRRDTMLSEGNKSKHHPRPRSTERIGKSRADFRTERKHDFDRRSDMDRRHDRRSDYRGDYRSDRRPDYHRSEVRPEPRPEPRMEKRIMKRLKPRPTLPADFAASDSVYYRKPGNESVIGSGTYGKVFKAVHVYTKKMVALKRIRMEGERDGFPVTAIREIKLLQSLKHENVVSLQEVMVEKNDCFMVFEYLSHDLTGLLNHPSFKLEHAHKKHLAKQLFEGLDYLHRRGVLHRDIKAANILISNTGQLKLADFGLARFFAKRRQLDYTNRVITIWYRSPELLLGETQYGPAVDIWSAACVLVEIFTKHAIFPGDGGEINQLDKIYNILGTPTVSEWPSLVDMAWFELLRPTEKKPSTFAEKYKERLTPAAFDLLSAMFAYDPVKRPDASEVLKHPYFTIEEPTPRSPAELENLEGDWHEFESKALRRENERRDKEARRALREEQYQKEKEKRRASANPPSERDPKRQRAEPPSANFHQQ
ncbi:Pkinase-domain-containing protein [Xylona heveae TC161]|uniref:cyclin-dependent kinase n=1 Tax=Xylona heveae (strain CBS 132557 / TC161) TaxID=1328760 RepID=A0A165AEM3_XYLHT|nr:Pkinase-domain-containing protein [Xylona heveae TC161]KZF20351.1 Pkinase-domain-containing protein [Xylona heveae TC161]